MRNEGGIAGHLLSIKRRLARCWRRFNRSPYIEDLRLIQIEHRHLYRERILSGSTGLALQALFQAFHSRHLKSQTQRSCAGTEGAPTTRRSA
jgi:hypothetical protein